MHPVYINGTVIWNAYQTHCIFFLISFNLVRTQQILINWQEKSDTACRFLPAVKYFLLFMPNHAIKWRACWPPGEPAAKMTEGSSLTNRAQGNTADIHRKLYWLPKETWETQTSPELQDRNGVQRSSSEKVPRSDPTLTQGQELVPVCQPGSQRLRGRMPN